MPKKILTYLVIIVSISNLMVVQIITIHSKYIKIKYREIYDNHYEIKIRP